MPRDLAGLTPQQRRVLSAVANPDVASFGRAIADAVGIGTSVYITLRRLEDFGLVAERWHPDGVIDDRGHRHRRTYELTALGRELA